MDRKTRQRVGVRAASSTTIEIQFQYKGKTLKKRLKKAPTESNLNWAAQHRAAILMEIDEGRFDYLKHFPKGKKAMMLAETPGQAMYLKDYLETWLQAQKPYLKAAGWNSDRKIIRNKLITTFGHLTLTQITRKHLRDYVNDNLHLSPQTLGNVVSPLRRALNDAVEDELIDHNPIADWKIRRKKKKGGRRKNDEIDPFSFKEQKAILKALLGQNKNMIQFWFWTGLRPSEIIALDWADIDWINERVYIDKALTQAADEVEETKTQAGEREVKLNEMSLAALKAQKAHTFLAHGEVFQNPQTGQRWEGAEPIRKTMWVYALQKAGVRYRPPKQIRHTRASVLLQSGESPMWVAKQMGHTDWTFTARTYSRYIPDNDPGAGSKSLQFYKEQTEES